MAYSIDFRKKALKFIDAGHTYAQLYETFGIYPSAIEDWRKLLNETGSLKPKYRKTRYRKIDSEKLKQAVENKPDAYLSELAEEFGCTGQAIFYALERLQITLKKNRSRIRKNLKKSVQNI